MVAKEITARVGNSVIVMGVFTQVKLAKSIIRARYNITDEDIIVNDAVIDKLVISDETGKAVIYDLDEVSRMKCEYKLTETGRAECERYICELRAKRKEILDAGKDTANEIADIWTPEALLEYLTSFPVDYDGCVWDSFAVTDNYDADSPLLLSLGKDFIPVQKEVV